MMRYVVQRLEQAAPYIEAQWHDQATYDSRGKAERYLFDHALPGVGIVYRILEQPSS